MVIRLPCSWSNEKIIVLDEVTISPPYESQNCAGSNQSSLSRVKKVVRTLCNILERSIAYPPL